MTPAEITALRRQLLGLFGNTCTIQREVVSGTDPYGAPIVSGWQDVATVRCAFGQASDAEAFSPERDRETADYQAALPLGTDVTGADQMVNVIGPDGLTRAAGPLAITSLLRAPTHILLTLREVD